MILGVFRQERTLQRPKWASVSRTRRFPLGCCSGGRHRSLLMAGLVSTLQTRHRAASVPPPLPDGGIGWLLDPRRGASPHPGAGSPVVVRSLRIPIPYIFGEPVPRWRCSRPRPAER